MSLPALFSLIFATLLGLLPIFLLVGRRAIASRLGRRRGDGQGEPPSGSAARGSGDRASEDRPAGDSPAPGRTPARLAVSGTGDPAGESAILDRLIRERRAAVEPEREIRRMSLDLRQSDSSLVPGTGNASARGTSPPDTSPRDTSPHDSSPRHGTGRGRGRTGDTGSRLEARLNRLSVLQRAVVYREILGPPVGLRAPGEHERY